MIKINFDLKDFEGKPLLFSEQNKEPMTFGKTVALILNTKRAGENRHSDPLKVYLLAQKFYSSEEVELDKADYKFIRGIIETDEMFTPLVVGQVLDLLDDLYEKNKASKSSEAEK